MDNKAHIAAADTEKTIVDGQPEEIVDGLFGEEYEPPSGLPEVLFHEPFFSFCEAIVDTHRLRLHHRFR